jgi:DNA-binding MarR family transcriptional regulator/N-acetylglutamate synthase-like GNAT family acetyltransferase
MPEIRTSERVAVVRRFNRFYTQRIGLLQEGWADGPFSLTQARVLYEIIHRNKSTASEIAKELGLDAGYLSRILRGFEVRGLIVRQTSDSDGRQSLVSMTPRGRKAFAPLEERSSVEVDALLRNLSTDEQRRLFDAMRAIEGVLGAGAEPKVPYMLRPPRPGDMGWIVARHGALYAQEYGWDDKLEALTAEIVAAFIRNYDPKLERGWIAERAGENVGCVLLVKASPRVARLRLLLVEPSARGLGIGARLVEECLLFARSVGYRKVTLWTHSVLTAARHVYENAGFKLVAKESHDEFGKTLVGETWDLEL